MIYTNDIEYDNNVTNENPFPNKIETDNLILRGPVHENWSLGDFHRFQTDNCGEEMAEYNLFVKPPTLAYTKNKMYNYMIESWKNMEDMYYVIEEKKDREDYNHDYIGLIGFDCEWDLKSGEIGIWLHKETWGNKYFAEATESIFEVVFNHDIDYGIELISVVPSSNNKNSIKATKKFMNKLNGQFEGVLRNYFLFDGIGIQNCHRFSIKKRDFNKRKHVN